jgi:hypothetical protein
MAALAAVTFVPAVLLVMLVPAFAGSMAFLRANMTLIPSILAYSVVQITLSAFLILALSSLSKSRWFVAILYAGLAFFTHAVFGVLGAAVEGCDRLATCCSACSRGTIRTRSSPRRSSSSSLRPQPSCFDVASARSRWSHDP